MYQDFCCLRLKERTMDKKSVLCGCFTRMLVFLACMLVVLGWGCRKKVPVPSESKPQANTQSQPTADPDGGYPIGKISKSESGVRENSLPYWLRKETELLYAEIKMGGVGYKVFLSEKSNSQIGLVPRDSTHKTPMWWGADRAGAFYLVGDKYYQLQRQNDRLLVVEYEGKLGVFQAGKGDRDVDEVSFSGSLVGKDISVAVGAVAMEMGWPEKTDKWQIPVGDYRPSHLTTNLDGLSINVSYNYHDDLQGRGMGDREPVYGIEIRQDKPFVYDFSNEPAVVFETPKKDQRFPRGEKIEVSAVLIDPKLDIMIRGLDDTTQEKTEEIKGGNGKVIGTTRRPVSLDPKVIISRLDGTVVVEGVMPFG